MKTALYKVWYNVGSIRDWRDKKMTESVKHLKIMGKDEEHIALNLKYMAEKYGYTKGQQLNVSEWEQETGEKIDNPDGPETTETSIKL